MFSRNTPQRYAGTLVGLHWLTLALLIVVYALIELNELAPKGSALRDGMKAWHFTLGLTVLWLTVLRVVLRWQAGPVPHTQPALPIGQTRLARLMQVTLYAFLLVMPVLGWLHLGAGGKVIPFYGWEMPALLVKDVPLSKQIKEIHELLGNVGYALIGLHAAAALWHHYVTRGNTLRLMLPGRR